MISYETLYQIVDSIFCSFGIFLNLLLIYCTVKKSPVTIATYSFLLLNCAITDLATCLVTLFVEPRILSYQDSILYISNGLCTYLGKKYCVIGYGLMVSLYAHLNWSQLASFVYRWYILRHGSPSKRLTFLTVLFVAAPTVMLASFGTLPYLMSHWDEDFAFQVAKIHPELFAENLTIYGAPHALLDIQASLPTSWITLPIFPITIAVFWIRSRILNFLSRSENSFSEQSKKLHRAFLQALTLQACLPPLFLVGISCFMVDIYFQLHHVVLEYGLYFFCGFIPILSPLFPLYFVGSYKKFIMDVLRIKENTIAQSGSSAVESTGQFNRI